MDIEGKIMIFAGMVIGQSIAGRGREKGIAELLGLLAGATIGVLIVLLL